MWCLRSVFLYLSKVVLHFLEVCGVEFTILVKIGALLTIAEHEIRYFFEIEILITREGKDFVAIMIVDNNEHF